MTTVGVKGLSVDVEKRKKTDIVIA